MKKVTDWVKFSEKRQKVAATFYKERYVHCLEGKSVDELFSPAEASEIIPGSAGLPRDYDPRASFRIYDTIEQKAWSKTHCSWSKDKTLCAMLSALCKR